MNEEILQLLLRERDLFLQQGKLDLVKSLEKSIENIRNIKEPIDSVKKLLFRKEHPVSSVGTEKGSQLTLNLKSTRKGKKQSKENALKETDKQTERPAQVRPKKKYVPKYRSAAYSLLLGLYNATVEQGLESIDKQGLITLSQPFCDSVLQRNGFVSSQSYSEQVSGWTSMNKILLKRQLARVVPGKRPLRYQLTEQGKELACHLVKNFAIKFNSKEISHENTNRIEHGNLELYRQVTEWGEISSCITHESTELFPMKSIQDDVVSEYQNLHVYVVLDNREVKGSGKSRKRLMEFLEILGVPVMLYQLELGDILFVALEDSVSAEERSSSKISKGRVLDYLIERKRNDDLASSLHDRRFSRQRYCMKQSNIGHLVYLIEGDLNAQEKENVDSLWQALMNTAMIDDFHIEYSKDVWESACFVRNLYQVVNSEVQKMPQADVVANISLEQWNKDLRTTKKPSGLELFKWQLMAIPGIDYRRAQEVVSYGIRSLTELGEQLDRYSTRDERIAWLQEISRKCGKKRWNRSLYETMEALFCSIGGTYPP
ncbi:hypothetical protein GAYE_SCF13G3496 [Galdieria yellowstonensis]|uniref:Crossover junction endonuclease MUS81 n=1 Tax=Galdieria yellowstonensis TaxID=3028027 RepID=A0AAV9IDX9_9RHOD|nr:hypothetical protein GAYE_SCF13G3496 [Galdieria yellowstonensis]